MSGTSAIQWTDSTWNPIGGCTRVTKGCARCYAFDLHDMRHQIYIENNGLWSANGKAMPKQYARPFSEIQLFPERLTWPLKQKRPQKIFVNSMSDLFHSRVPEEYIRQIFDVMCQADWHTFQILTKRPGRLRQLAPSLPWPSNIWMGVSVESDQVVGRIDALRCVPAAVRFLSCEPLIGPIPSLNLEGISWVITGGESGILARPLDLDWVRPIRDKCLAEGVAFFHKQNGGRTPKAGGRELDGQIWSAFPGEGLL